MNLNFYRFESIWHVPASATASYDALESVQSYPEWWPEIKEARRLSDGSGQLRVRSLLPYELTFSVRRTTQDGDRGVLEAALEGDLEGFSRWTITGTESFSTLVFDEEVVVNRRSLRLLAPLARPAFKLNHTLMMRSGERGLRSYLSGYSSRDATTSS